jgi:hypothetical protein
MPPESPFLYLLLLAYFIPLVQNSVLWAEYPAIIFRSPAAFMSLEKEAPLINIREHFLNLLMGIKFNVDLLVQLHISFPGSLGSGISRLSSPKRAS